MIVDLETFLTLETQMKLILVLVNVCTLAIVQTWRCVVTAVSLVLCSALWMGKRGGGGECSCCFTHGFSGFPLLLSFFLQTAPHVTTLLQIYSDLCAHQNLQKRPIQLKFKMSQHHSEKTSVADSRKQRKNFAWLGCVYYMSLLPHPLFICCYYIKTVQFSVCYSNQNHKVGKIYD